MLIATGAAPAIDAPELLRRKFREIGARLAVTDWGRDRDPFFRIGVQQTHCLERFVTSGTGVLISVPDIDVGLRQLLVLAAWTDRAGRQVERRHLCGFDERHWFSAELPATPGLPLVTVATAQEALKPEAVRISQAIHRVRPPLVSEGWNPGFVRQGEWFFIPRPDVSFDIRQARRNEELRRGLGKPHVVQYLAVVGELPGFSWDDSDRRVYARGMVRHRDHRTIKLAFWHQVELSREVGVPIGLD